ncbi:TLDc domain-containing protein [Entamoeba marina]
MLTAVDRNLNNSFDYIVVKSIELLCEWCHKTSYTIIFDSDIDGNGKEILATKVFNKGNVCFIHIDEEKNVFGGYITSKIDKFETHISDSNAFVFSLVRNGIFDPHKYDILKEEQQDAFLLYESNDCLYNIGGDLCISCDISASKINDPYSFCDQTTFNYKGIEKALHDKQEYVKPFPIKRIISVLME